MSKAGTIALIVLIAAGVAMIPTGILINNAISNEVVGSIDEGLLGIHEGAIPMVESMIAESGIPETLRGIRKVGLFETEKIVNATFFMFLINMTYHEEPTLGVVPISLFFDRWIQWVLIIPVTFSSAIEGMGYPPIKGISEYFQQNLWYGDAKYRLIEGTDTLPGLVGNNTMGTGVLEFLELHDSALDNPSLQQGLAQGYNTTWIKLSRLAQYYREYFVPIAIPMLVANLDTIMPEYAGMNTFQIAESYFYGQWANCTMYEEGIDFSTLIDGVNEPLYGFEVGRISPSNIKRSSIYLLWDDNNLASLTNDSGINEWINAENNYTKQEELCSLFSLEEEQMSMILYWLWEESFKWNIVPILMTLPRPQGEGMTLNEYANQLFLEVWTNGTADGKAVYPYGFPLSLKSGTKFGFEIGYQGQKVPVFPTNISLVSAKSLWNTSNQFSLVTKSGLKEWLGVLEDPNSAAAFGLLTANSLTEFEMNMILEWLQRFGDNVMPFLAQEEMNLPMDSASLGNTIQIGIITAGITVVGISTLLLTRMLIRKKKTRV